MKFILASRAKPPANRAEAWACATANIALPGTGSLAAGKAIGYYQLALATLGFILTMITGVRMLEWMMDNWARLNGVTGDPFETLADIGRHLIGPLGGMCIFVLALLWAGWTSRQLLAAHPKNPVPPRIPHQ